MKLRSVLPMRVAKYGYIAISIIFCLVGIALILLPMPSMSAISLFFGIAMLVFGIFKLIGYYSKDLFRLAFQYDLQFGILLIILGTVTLFMRKDALRFICVAYGVCLMADCLFRIGIAFDAKHFGIQSWWVTLVLAIFGGIVGLLLTVCPVAALEAAKVLLGVSLFAEGILSLSMVVSMVKIIKHQQPDVIIADEYEI
jgi:uncharacterized membrane protein HdeD (DUF308 family)